LTCEKIFLTGSLAERSAGGARWNRAGVANCGFESLAAAVLGGVA
jgi:hypothetical protein